MVSLDQSFDAMYKQLELDESRYETLKHHIDYIKMLYTNVSGGPVGGHKPSTTAQEDHPSTNRVADGNSAMAEESERSKDVTCETVDLGDSSCNHSNVYPGEVAITNSGELVRNCSIEKVLEITPTEHLNDRRQKCSHSNKCSSTSSTEPSDGKREMSKNYQVQGSAEPKEQHPSCDSIQTISNENKDGGVGFLCEGQMSKRKRFFEIEVANAVPPDTGEAEEEQSTLSARSANSQLFSSRFLSPLQSEDERRGKKWASRLLSPLKDVGEYIANISTNRTWTISPRKSSTYNEVKLPDLTKKSSRFRYKRQTSSRDRSTQTQINSKITNDKKYSNNKNIIHNHRESNVGDLTRNKPYKTRLKIKQPTEGIQRKINSRVVKSCDAFCGSVPKKELRSRAMSTGQGQVSSPPTLRRTKNVSDLNHRSARGSDDSGTTHVPSSSSSRSKRGTHFTWKPLEINNAMEPKQEINKRTNKVYSKIKLNSSKGSDILECGNSCKQPISNVSNLLVSKQLVVIDKNIANHKQTSCDQKSGEFSKRLINVELSDKEHFKNVDFKTIPFVAGRSTAPSHNLKLNVQQTRHKLKLSKPERKLSQVSTNISNESLLPHICNTPKIIEGRKSHCALLNRERLLGRKSYRDSPNQEVFVEVCDKHVANKASFKSTPNKNDQGTDDYHKKEDICIAKQREGVSYESSKKERRPHSCDCSMSNYLRYHKVLEEFQDRGDQNSPGYKFPPKRGPITLRHKKDPKLAFVNRSFEHNSTTSKKDGVPPPKKYGEKCLKGKDRGANYPEDAKSLGVLLQDLYEEFSRLHLRYESLRAESPEEEGNMLEELWRMEEELEEKEEEISVVTSLFQEVRSLKSQVQALKRRASATSVIASSTHPANSQSASLTRTKRLIQDIQHFQTNK